LKEVAEKVRAADQTDHFDVVSQRCCCSAHAFSCDEAAGSAVDAK
jgi:hypothetical protein